MKTIIIIASLIGLSACATHPVPVSEAQPVPAARIYAHGQQSPAQNAAVRVARDAGFRGKHCNVVIGIDGTKTANIDAGESATLYVKPGPHTVKSSVTTWACGHSDEQQLIRPAAGQTVNVRVYWPVSGSMRMAETRVD